MTRDRRMQRDQSLHRRAMPAARQRQVSSELPHPAPHPGNANPQFGEGILRGHWETEAVVIDPEPQACPIHLDPDGDLGRPGMAVDIRESLLNHSENSPLHGRDCPIRGIIDLADEAQARAPGESLNEVPQG